VGALAVVCWVTGPLGRAVVTAAASIGQILAMTIDSIGCGAGERRRPEIVSRVVVGRGRDSS
jgi:hypothetical protein